MQSSRRRSLAIRSRLLSELLSLGDRLVDPADHVESSFRKMVKFAIHDRLERADRVLELDELAGDAGKDLGDVERLREEALDLAGAADGQLVLFRQLVHAEDGDDVLQALVLLQGRLDRSGGLIMLLADDARLEN